MKWYNSVFKYIYEQADLIRSRSERGIEEARKGDAKLVFLNAAGDSLSNVTVKATHRTHDFKFGCASFPLGGFDTDEKNRKFEEAYAGLFNLAVAPLYWNTLEPEKGNPRYAADSPKIYRRPAPDLVCDFAEKHGMSVKGHALVYCGHAPEWIEDDIPSYKQLLEDRIASIANRYKNRISDWDVVNESLHWFERENAVMRAKPLTFHHSDGYVEWCMQTARKYLPNNHLIINDHAGFVTCNDFAFEREPFLLQLKLLRLENLTPDAAGIQMHLWIEKDQMLARFFQPDVMYEVYDYWQHFGMPLNLSELTIPAYSENDEDEEFQAILTETLYRLWFGHPALESVVWWDMVDGHCYFDKTCNSDTARFYQGLLRRDFSRKPAYNRLHDLIHKEWHTEVSGNTGNGNMFSMRGFCGKYDLEIEHEGRIFHKQFHLSREVQHSRGVHRIVLE